MAFQINSTEAKSQISSIQKKEAWKQTIKNTLLGNLFLRHLRSQTVGNEKIFE